MKDTISSVSLEYGDAKINVFGIKIDNSFGFTSTWHRHNYYEIHCSRNKICQYEFENQNITFNPSQALIIPPHIAHNTFATFEPQNNGCVVFAFAISKIKSDKLFYDQIIEALDKNSLVPFDIPQKTIEDIISLNDITLYDSFLGTCKLKSIASNVIYHIFSNILNNINSQTTKGEILPVLIDVLINNPHYKLSDIAKATSYSERQISRIIKQHYGMSLLELRRKMKDEIIDNENINKKTEI